MTNFGPTVRAQHYDEVRLEMVKKYKNTIIASLGVGVEYYDFIVYGLMGMYLSDIFFQTNEFTNKFYYFSIFALGYVCMPLGAIISGLISDKYGRRKTFSFLILLMAIATFVVGILPVDKEWLVFSVVILVMARMVQGMALGGELPNAVTVIYESSNKDPVHSSMISSSAVFSNILALFVLYCLSKLLSNEEILSWGWRIPFLIGAAFSLTCYFLRKNLAETGEYISVRNRVLNQGFFNPLKLLIASGVYKLLIAIMISIATRTLIVIYIYIPTYIKQVFSYPADQIYSATIIALVFSLCFAPFVGVIIKKIGAKKTMFFAAALLLLSSYLMFKLFSLENHLALIAALLLYQLFHTSIYVSSLILVSGLFRTEVRNTALSVSYSLGYVVAGAIPAILSSLVENTGNSQSILLWFVSVVSTLAITGALLCNYYDKKASHD